MLKYAIAGLGFWAALTGAAWAEETCSTPPLTPAQWAALPDTDRIAEFQRLVQCAEQGIAAAEEHVRNLSSAKIAESAGTWLSERNHLAEVVKTYAAQLVAAQDEINSLTRGRTALEDEIKSLKDALAKAESDRDAYLAALTTANGQIGALVRENADLKAALDDADSRLAAKQKELDDANQQLAALDARVNALSAALDQTNQKMASLQEALDGANAKIAALGQTIAALNASLADANGKMAALQASLDAANGTIGTLNGKIDSLNGEVDTLNGQVAALNGQVNDLKAALAGSTDKIAALTASVAELQAALATANGKADDLQAALKDANARIGELQAALKDATDKNAALTAALAGATAKIAELTTALCKAGEKADALANRLAPYSEQFALGLKQVLAGRTDVFLDGNRVIVAAEVLFPTGSADLSKDGLDTVTRAAAFLKDFAPQVPADLTWWLQVNGHTDARAIHNKKFASNWELSTARALSVVNALIRDPDVPAGHLAAAGFAEYQPLAPGSDPEVLQHNRRIEMEIIGTVAPQPPKPSACGA